MTDDFQQQALGRSNAAIAAMFALLARFAGDAHLLALLETHLENARANLLNTSTPEIALAEFDRAAKALLDQSKNHPQA